MVMFLICFNRNCVKLNNLSLEPHRANKQMLDSQRYNHMVRVTFLSGLVFVVVVVFCFVLFFVLFYQLHLSVSFYCCTALVVKFLSKR